jgi:hypothetical protein
VFFHSYWVRNQFLGLFLWHLGSFPFFSPDFLGSWYLHLLRSLTMRERPEQFFFRSEHKFFSISQRANLIFWLQFFQSLCGDRKRLRDKNSTLL